MVFGTEGLGDVDVSSLAQLLGKGRYPIFLGPIDELPIRSASRSQCVDCGFLNLLEGNRCEGRSCGIVGVLESLCLGLGYYAVWHQELE